MHLTSSLSAILALALTANGLDLSKSQDSDPSVWPAQEASSHETRDSQVWNRPEKRQSGWNPPSNLVTPLKQVWDHCKATYSNGLFGFRNYGWDQIRATSGYASSCLVVNSWSMKAANQFQIYQCLRPMGVQHPRHRSPAQADCYCLQPAVSEMVPVGLWIRRISVFQHQGQCCWLGCSRPIFAPGINIGY